MPFYVIESLYGNFKFEKTIQRFLFIKVESSFCGDKD